MLHMNVQGLPFSLALLEAGLKVGPMLSAFGT